MKFKCKRAFSLVELIIAMGIFFILVMITYVPYNFYMNKVKVKNTIKEISKSLYEARNMSINGITSGSNRSVGLLLENNGDKISFLSYPFSYTGSQIRIDTSLDPNIEFVKSYDLIDGIKIKSIDGKDINNLNSALFYYDAITGKGKYFYWDGLGRDEINSTEINIEFSYRGAPVGSPLYGKLKYLTDTNIVDYY